MIINIAAKRRLDWRFDGVSSGNFFVYALEDPRMKSMTTNIKMTAEGNNRLLLTTGVLTEL